MSGTFDSNFNSVVWQFSSNTKLESSPILFLLLNIEISLAISCKPAKL